jgi:hypothetical protein
MVIFVFTAILFTSDEISAGYMAMHLQMMVMIGELMNLLMSGMKPDVIYSFSENKFHVGEIKSYTEVQYVLNLAKKTGGFVTVDLEFSYFVKDKLNTTTKRVFEEKI